ncbi:MAG: LPXTG cell wall anchor domain-containing protein [Corynebacterium casei]|uniref:LPXTG cell wall anchor domain-containing protein n=1 Tax=Corynebacterium casei TaxID=160386 RepID=UPI003BC0E2D2
MNSSILNKYTFYSRAASIIVALVLTLSVATIGIASAAAATIVGTVGGLEPGSINPDTKASLTVSVKGANRFDDEPAGELPRGGVEGFTFTAHRIADVDLTTMEGWNRAENYSLSKAKEAEYSHEFVAKTDAKGFAYFEEIPVGLYFVTAAVPADGRHSYKKPQDMLLTIPVGQSTGDAVFWQYDVQIKAKYSPDKPIIIPPIPVPVPVPGGNPPGSETVAEYPPVTTDVPPGDTTPGGGTVDNKLAETGASVIWMTVVAVLLIISGFVLLAKKRREDSSEVHP